MIIVHRNPAAAPFVIKHEVLPGGGRYFLEPGETLVVVSAGSLGSLDAAGSCRAIAAPGLYHSVGAGRELSNPSPADILEIFTCHFAGPGDDIRPRSGHLAFPEADGRLQVIGARHERRKALRLERDAVVHAAQLLEGDTPSPSLERNRRGWLAVLHGHLFVCGSELKSGELAEICDEPVVAMYAAADSLVLYLDFPR